MCLFKGYSTIFDFIWQKRGLFRITLVAYLSYEKDGDHHSKRIHVKEELQGHETFLVEERPILSVLYKEAHNVSSIHDGGREFWSSWPD